MKPKLYLKAVKGALQHSAPSKDFLNILFLNAIFILSILIGFKVLTTLTQDQFTSISAVNLDNMQEKSAEEMQAISRNAQSFLKTILKVGSFFLIIEMIILAITQARVYSILGKKKLKVSHFLLAHLFWAPVWIIAFFAVAFAGQPAAYQAAMAVLALLFIHFTLILYGQLAKHPLGPAFANTFKRGIMLHRFVIPYSIIFLVYLVLGTLTLATRLLPRLASQSANIILLLLLMSWVQVFHARFYSIET